MTAYEVPQRGEPHHAGHRRLRLHPGGAQEARGAALPRGLQRQAGDRHGALTS